MAHREPSAVQRQRLRVRLQQQRLLSLSSFDLRHLCSQSTPLFARSAGAGHSCGAHFFAHDPRGPWKMSAEAVYGPDVTLTNGSNASFQTRQRPQLVFGADGAPLYLFTSGSFEGNNPDLSMLTHTFAHGFKTGDEGELQRPVKSDDSGGGGRSTKMGRGLWTTRPDPAVSAVNRAALDTAVPSTPGGPYGLAQTPHMGWRSWNAYHNTVNQTLLEAVMEAMVAKQNDGRSLSDLGFTSVGLDDAWQGFDSGKPGIDACQRGYNGTFHDEHGNPLWAKATFPDPAGMVAKAHSLGLKAGWYMNNCRE